MSEQDYENVELDTEINELLESEELSEESNETEEIDWKAEALKQKAIAARLAKKLQRPAQESTPAPKVENSQNNQAQSTPSTEQIEELLLRDKGFDDEAIAQIRAVAKGKGIGLLAAKEDALVKAYLDLKADEKKRTDAKLGASTGSGRTKAAKPISEMTREEHEALWRKASGLDA